MRSILMKKGFGVVYLIDGMSLKGAYSSFIHVQSNEGCIDSRQDWRLTGLILARLVFANFKVLFFEIDGWWVSELDCVSMVECGGWGERIGELLLLLLRV